MSDETDLKYFYADAPSPLHEARERFHAQRKEAKDAIEAFIAEIGAKDAYHSRGAVVGFSFDKAPPNTLWKRSPWGKGWLPKKNSNEGRALAKRVAALSFPETDSIIPRELVCWRCTGRVMRKSAIGWWGDRIFLTIPCSGDGDDFPSIPDYLIPCKRWEMEKFADEFSSAEAGAS